MKKRLLLLISMLLPLMAIADDSGSCGENLTYSYVEATNTLIISGIGEMADYNGKESPWSEYQSEITTIIINEGVTSIGAFAFLNCSNLISVTIPESVTIIVDGAFEDCTTLANIVIPSSVTRIGNKAFLGCGSLTSISIPNSVNSIGSGAFYGCI